MIPIAYQQQQPRQSGRPVSRAMPGQQLTAATLNAISRQATTVAISNQQVQPGGGDPQATITFTQGNADFPAANGTFGVLVFPDEAYEIWGYYLTYSGSGSFTVQLQIGGSGVGPVISSVGGTGTTTLIDEADRPVYDDDDTCSLKVLTTSGTITNFCIVFRCWVRA